MNQYKKLLDDSSSYGDVWSERTLFVDIFTIFSSVWGFKSKSDVFIISLGLKGFILEKSSAVQEDCVLFLESSLMLGRVSKWVRG